MKYPKISVIIPVYNGEKNFERCIKSVVNQTYSNLEIIIIDDGSTDNTSFLCDTYAKNDERITVYHIKNGGVSNARNFGLNNFTGEYCTFVDADDYISDIMIEKLYSAIIKYSVKLATCSNYQIKEKELDMKIIKHDEEKIKKINVDYYDFTDDYAHPIAWAALYHNSIIKDLYFSLDLFVGEDSLFFAEALNRCDYIVNINEKLYYYILYSNSLSQGIYDNRKLTEINAWKRICKVFKKRSGKVSQNCKGALAARCLWGIKRLVMVENYEFEDYNYLISLIRKNIYFLIKSKVGIKEKISYIMVAIFSKYYLEIYIKRKDKDERKYRN